VHQITDKNETLLHTPLQNDKNLSHYFLIKTDKVNRTVCNMQQSGLNEARFGYVIIIHPPQNMTDVDSVVVDSCVVEEVQKHGWIEKR
jgi:hypothetical protein